MPGGRVPGVWRTEVEKKTPEYHTLGAEKELRWARTRAGRPWRGCGKGDRARSPTPGSAPGAGRTEGKLGLEVAAGPPGLPAPGPYV